MKKDSWKNADVSRGERLARNVLRELDIRHPPECPIDDVAFLRGALVQDIALDGAEGRLVRVGDKGTISVNTSVWYKPRRRWVVAHELGHFEMHDEEDNQLELALCDEKDINERYDQGTEREANVFAAELLMPRSLWDKEVDVAEPSLQIVSDLSKKYDVSFTAAAIRFAKLSEERCAVVFSKDGKVKWAAYSKDFAHWVEPGRKVSKFTSAYDYSVGKRVSERELVPAGEWLESGRIGSDEDLVEYCRPIDSIKASLSLLWIPPDADY